MAISSIDNSAISGVLAQMRQIAQSGALPEAQAPATDFADVLKGSLARVSELHSNAKDLSEKFELGDPQVSLPQVVVALEKASLSFEAVKSVRNRLLAAYQEIMNMQV